MIASSLYALVHRLLYGRTLGFQGMDGYHTQVWTDMFTQLGMWSVTDQCPRQSIDDNCAVYNNVMDLSTKARALYRRRHGSKSRAMLQH